jgi:hypothetical protein
MDGVTNFTLPVIALVLITVLNDGTIISIAYDKVYPSQKPEKWEMKKVWGKACVLGFVACASSLLYVYITLDNSLGRSIGLRDLEYSEIITGMYLKVSLSDFLTVMSARTDSFFFERRPGYLLMGAFAMATGASSLLACFWPFDVSPDMNMSPLGGGWTVATWVYCLLWFIGQDMAKVLFDKLLHWAEGRNMRLKRMSLFKKNRQKLNKSKTGRNTSVDQTRILQRLSSDLASSMLEGSNVTDLNTTTKILAKIRQIEAELRRIKFATNTLAKRSERTLGSFSGAGSMQNLRHRVSHSVDHS